MSEQRDPRRWLESGYLSEELARELTVYGAQAPAAVSKARMFERLAAQVELAPALQATKPVALAKLKLLLGSVVVLAGAVGLLQFRPALPVAARALEFNAPVQEARLRMAPLELSALAASTEPAPVEHRGTVLARPVRVQPKPVATRTVSLPPPEVALPSRSGGEVVQELTMLARARRALLNEPERALALTSEHARAYPRGTFEEEREVIAIESLLKLARLADAAAREKAFEAHFPRSPHIAHLAKMIAKPSE